MLIGGVGPLPQRHEELSWLREQLRPEDDASALEDVFLRFRLPQDRPVEPKWESLRGFHLGRSRRLVEVLHHPAWPPELDRNQALSDLYKVVPHTVEQQGEALLERLAEKGDFSGRLSLFQELAAEQLSRRPEDVLAVFDEMDRLESMEPEQARTYRDLRSAFRDPELAALQLEAGGDPARALELLESSGRLACHDYLSVAACPGFEQVEEAPAWFTRLRQGLPFGVTFDVARASRTLGGLPKVVKAEQELGLKPEVFVRWTTVAEEHKGLLEASLALPPEVRELSLELPDLRRQGEALEQTARRLSGRFEECTERLQPVLGQKYLAGDVAPTVFMLGVRHPHEDALEVLEGVVLGSSRFNAIWLVEAARAAAKVMKPGERGEELARRMRMARFATGKLDGYEGLDASTRARVERLRFAGLPREEALSSSQDAPPGNFEALFDLWEDGLDEEVAREVLTLYPERAKPVAHAASRMEGGGIEADVVVAFLRDGARQPQELFGDLVEAALRLPPEVAALGASLPKLCRPGETLAEAADRLSARYAAMDRELPLRPHLFVCGVRSGNLELVEEVVRASPGVEEVEELILAAAEAARSGEDAGQLARRLHRAHYLTGAFQNLDERREEELLADRLGFVSRPFADWVVRLMAEGVSEQEALGGLLIDGQPKRAPLVMEALGVAPGAARDFFGPVARAVASLESQDLAEWADRLARARIVGSARPEEWAQLLRGKTAAPVEAGDDWVMIGSDFLTVRDGA